MQKNSVAKKYVFVLIFSLLPFFIGITYSISQSSDRAYYGAAINIAGSQRMRTMLLSNYSQLFVKNNHEGSEADVLGIKEILLKEKAIYESFYSALLKGDPSLNMKAPVNGEIRGTLVALDPFIKRYLSSIQAVLIDHEDQAALAYITSNALYIKDNYHQITELFQKVNDASIARQRTLDIGMILLAGLITVAGLLLTNRIKQQEYHAYFDYLTKLKNRHSFYTDIGSKDPTQYSILFIDLNKFKLINDTYGHQVGDEILVGVAGKLRETFGDELLYRYGGDEFIALLQEQGEEALVEARIEALKLRLAEPIIDSSQRHHFVGLALGVVTSQVGITSWDVLINLSDDLMYDSKSIPGHVLIYRSREDLDCRLKLIDSVDHGFKNGLISLNYSSMKSVAAEKTPIYTVTSRWLDHGQVFKAKEFLPLLKRRGFLPMLDQNTLQQLEWDIAERSSDRIGSPIKPGYIVSITEDTLINAQENRFMDLASTIQLPRADIYFKVQDEWLNDQGILKQLNALKAMGYKVAIDLDRLELSLHERDIYGIVDLVKLGNGLVKTLMTTVQTKHLMKAFVNLITDRNLITVLEGLAPSDYAGNRDILDFHRKELVYMDVHETGLEKTI